MDLSGINAALSTLCSYDTAGVDSGSMAYAVGIKMLDKTLDLDQSMNQQLMHAMEQSVTPYLGSNIDTYA